MFIYLHTHIYISIFATEIWMTSNLAQKKDQISTLIHFETQTFFPVILTLFHTEHMDNVVLTFKQEPSRWV